MLQLHRVAYQRFDTGRRESQLYHRRDVTDRGRSRRGLNPFRLASDFLKVLFHDLAQRCKQPLLQRAIVAALRQTDSCLVPAKIDPWDLPEESIRGLEHNRMGEGHHASGRAEGTLGIQLQKMHAHQSEINDLSGHRADLYSIPDAQAVFSD